MERNILCLYFYVHSAQILNFSAQVLMLSVGRNEKFAVNEERKKNAELKLIT